MKYIISFLFGVLISFVFLLINTFYNLTDIVDKTATRYYQIFYPEQLIQNNKEYTVSFGFIPVVQEQPTTVVSKPKPVSPKVDVNNTTVNNTPKESPKLVIAYSYQHNYDGFTQKDVEDVFKKVENAWAECGVKLKYTGASSNPYYSGKSLYADDETSTYNYLYWVNEKGIYGEANVQSAKETSNGTKPFVHNFSIKLDTAIGNKDRLEATIVHEFGHVIGLNHSSDPASVMYFQGEEKQNKTPNAFDIQECKNVLSQIDLAKTNQMLNH